MKFTTEQQVGQPTPAPQSYRYYSEPELLKCLTAGSVSANAILALMEKILEQDKTIAILTKRIAYLEKKALKTPGRKKHTFYYDDQELTDEYLMRLIDEGYFDSIGKLEKAVGASKNQLRNRYNKAKAKLRLERQVERHGNC